MGAMMEEFMTEVTIPIPQTLYDRIALRAEEIGMRPEQLAGVWLWEIERQKRMHGDEQPETWTAPC